MAKASDFVQAPFHLLVPNRRLEADLYIYFQLNNTVVHFRRIGDQLSDKDLASLAKVPRNCVLIPRAQWASVMEMAVGEISLELDRTDSVDTPAVRAAAKTVLDGLDAQPSPTNAATTSPAPDSGEATMRDIPSPGSAASAAAAAAVAPEPPPDSPGAADSAAMAREALSEAATLVEKMLLTAKKNRSLQAYEQVIHEWKEEKNPLISHHRQVSAMAVLILLVLGGASYEDFTDIGLAGLIHDLGLLSAPSSILQRHLLGAENFNSSEKMVFMKHVDTTIEMLKQHGLSISPGATRIVQLHHENWDGTGFKGLKGAQIYRPARVLRLADAIVSRMNSQAHEGGFREAVTAVAVEIGSSGEPVYDPEIVAALAAESSQDLRR